MKTQIRVLDYPTFIPPDLINQTEGVYLDLPEDFDFRLTRQLEELTDLKKIKQDVALSFNLDFTPINNLLFQKFANTLKVQDIEPLTIEIIKDDTRIPFEKLFVTDVDDVEEVYVITIRNGNWLSDLSELRLCDIELGTFDYSLTNVLASWGNTSDLVIFPPIDYGPTLIPDNYTLKDLRPMFNVGKLLKAAFCEIGWTFNCPYYEGQRGSRLYNTASPDKWYSYENKDGTAFNELEVIPDFELENITNIEFNVITDLESRWIESNGIWGYDIEDTFEGETLKIDIDFVVDLHPPTDPADDALFFSLQVSSGFNFYLFHFAQGPKFGEPIRKIEIKRTIEIESVVRPSLISFFGSYKDTNTGTIGTCKMKSGNAYFRNDPPYLVEDDTFEIKNLLDCELTALDILKSASHYINGKFDTNHAKRTVTLYPPYDTNDSVESFQGFFHRDGSHNEITDKVVAKSRKKKIEREEVERFVLLQFKNSSDAYLKTLNFPNSQFLSRLVDLKKGKGGKPKKIESHIWEASIDREVEFGGQNRPSLMVIWDNDNSGDDPKLTVNGGVRLCYHYGLIEQLDIQGQPTRELRFNGELITEFGYVSTNRPFPLSSNETKFPLGFSAGGYDAYSMFYREYLQEMFSGIDFEFLVFVTLLEFLSLDFRRPYGFNYKGSYQVYQLTKARDFSVETKLTTPFNFTPLISCEDVAF